MIRVRDDGPGIPKEMLERIFEPFVQIGPSRGGLGLGLTLVRTLVELHGGTVHATSEGLGRGTEMVVRLPVAPSESIPASLAPRTDDKRERRAGARRVLVVDDNVDAADSVAEAIRESGDDVAVVHDGTSALAEAHAFCPSVVVLDLDLPGIDGYEVARRLRAEDSLHALRLVALTGYGQQADKKRADDAGFDAYLVKPASFEELDAAMGPPTSDLRRNGAGDTPAA